MKKINTTYLDNLVSKILKETLEERADNLVSKIKGDVCECGGNMYEGECEECGYKGEMDEDIHDVKDINNANGFDYVGENDMTLEDDEDEDAKETCIKHIKMFGKDDEVTQKVCQGANLSEALKGRQKKLDKNQNNKIDSEDFKMMRQGKKSETKEGKKFPDLTGDGKVTRKDVLVGRGVKLDKHKKKVKESYRLTEDELVSMIENIVKEQKEKSNIKVVGGSPRGLETFKQIHKKDGKENDEYIKSVAKKMKDYLKDGSKGEYDMNPKMFPKGNGELEKMSKKAYVMSKDGQEFIDDYMSPGMENLDYDEIEPNESQITSNIEGSSKTGNNQKWANAVETDVNKNINKKRKENKFAKARRNAYQKAPQPVRDATGEDSGSGINIKLESTEKKEKLINEEFKRINSLIGYNQKTQ